MSFILDALRKSEIERQRQSGPSIAEIPVAREDRRLPVALIAIGVLLVVNVGVLLFFLLRDGSAPEPATAAPAPAENTPAIATTPLASSAPAVMPAPNGNEMFRGDPDRGPETYAQNAPAATMAPDAPDPTLLPDPQAPMPRGSVTYDNAPPAPRDTLPTDPGSGLPALSVDLHIYTDDAAKRAIFINGRRYTQGSVIAEGPMVEEITQDGAVLNFRGRRFLLPRQ